MITGSFDQGISFSTKFGGVRRVFEQKPEVAYGGFKFNLEDLPTAGQVLPAGAPVYCDEDKRTITPIYTATVKEVAETVVTFAKESWGVPLKEGMVTSDGSTITGIEISDSVYKVTLDKASASATKGAVVTFFPKSVGSTGVKANALLYGDVCLDKYAQWANGDGVWFGIMLARRTFPLTDAIKTQLLNAGCFVHLSYRK